MSRASKLQVTTQWKNLIDAEKTANQSYLADVCVSVKSKIHLLKVSSNKTNLSLFVQQQHFLLDSVNTFSSFQMFIRMA